MKQKLNSAWHLKHPMPKHPTFAQRVKWHLAHQKHCACREIPAKLLDEMRRQHLVPDERKS